MKLKEIIHETAEAVKTIKYLSGVPVIEEEKGDLTAERQKKIGQSKVCVQVGWNGAEPVKQSADVILADVNIVVSVFEKPAVNRKAANAPTICNMAQEIANALTYMQAEGMNCPLFLKRISNISEVDGGNGGTVVCFVVFSTKAVL